jgi:hypothetical protein
MKCGQDGKGYRVKLPSQLLKVLAPALRWGFLAIKIILATQGDDLKLSITLSKAEVNRSVECCFVFHVMRSPLISAALSFIQDSGVWCRRSICYPAFRAQR